MLVSFRRLFAICLTLFGVGGCSSEGEFTADASGSYTVAITNRESSCPFSDWEEGKETSGIELAITQSGQQLHGTLGGVTGAFFALAFGSAEFDGHIEGHELTLTNYGTRATTTGNCIYTYDATVRGTQSADTIAGTITYSTNGNGSPDCGGIACSARQDFSGTRPPQ